MKTKFLIIFFINSALLNSQIKDSYQLKDTILVVGESYIEDISQQKINLEDFRSAGLVNYDLINSLRAIGMNTVLDFNTIPYIEGADFHEQQFFINNIPVPFQSRLIGLQSGLNSLLFSQLSLLETHSLSSYSKPIKLRLATSKIDTSQIHYKANINILHFENVVTVPIKNLGGGISIGYNRSLLETIKPFLGRSISNDDFEYKKFPFFQGFQLLAEFSGKSLTIKPIFIYSNDTGEFGINTKGFNFHSHQLNYGVEIQAEVGKLKSSSQVYSNMGANHIEYKFPEIQKNYVEGKADLSFEEFGLNSNIEYLIKTNHTLILSFNYKHQNANSENKLLYIDKDNSKIASFSSDFFKGSVYYKYLFSNKILSTFHFGLNAVNIYNVYPSFGLDIYYNNPILFDVRFQISHDSFIDPINPIFFSFQNAIWEPSSSSSMFFVDDSKLPLLPIKCLFSSINLRKRISSSIFETTVSVKFFLRQLKNLQYANNYPDEVTIDNSDFEFNQDYNGIRYGLSILFDNEIKLLSLKNITTVNLCKSINRNYKNDIEFYSLNYSPLSITNLTQYNLGNFFISTLFIYSSGRYVFDKEISSNYSSHDSVYSSSISTNFFNQLNLQPYISMDISFLYKVISSGFDIDVGLSFLNIFDHKNESRRSYSLDSSNEKLTTRSEYYNFPRFVIFWISMNLRL